MNAIVRRQDNQFDGNATNSLAQSFMRGSKGKGGRFFKCSNAVEAIPFVCSEDWLYVLDLAGMETFKD